MTTIATYRIALLNKPPLGATGADRPATIATKVPDVGILLPSKPRTSRDAT